jgi:ketosteroid isomerase-like protein
MREAALEVAEQLFAALERGDADAVRDLYAPDVAVWHNFDDLEQDRETNLATLAWMTRTLQGLRYEIVRREAIEGGFLQQHVLHARFPDGREIAMPACMVVRVDDGRITRIDEYLDPRPVTG